MDNNSKAWKLKIYDRIRLAYGAKNFNRLAIILNEKFGIVRTTVHAWSQGRSKPTEKMLQMISKDRGKSVDYFLSGMEDLIDAPITKEALLGYAAADLDLLRDKIGYKDFEQFLIKQLNKNTFNILQAKQTRDKKKQA